MFTSEFCLNLSALALLNQIENQHFFSILDHLRINPIDFQLEMLSLAMSNTFDETCARSKDHYKQRFRTC